MLLLAVGKSVFHSLAARFTVLGFLGVPRTRDSSEPSRPAPWTSQWEPSAAELWEALQSTVASQGSCFPVLLSLPVSLSLSGMRTIAFLRGESFLLPSPAVSKDPVCSQCPMLQVPNAGHHRAPALGPAGSQL